MAILLFYLLYILQSRNFSLDEKSQALNLPLRFLYSIVKVCDQAGCANAIANMEMSVGLHGKLYKVSPLRVKKCVKGKKNLKI